MTCYDVFNGDADGLCALQQLRLREPRSAVRVSGLKRDIALLGRVDAGPGDEITVLDVSLDKNRDALRACLERGARVFYADHHYPGEIPSHPSLDCHIDTAADTCTSLIVNRLLDGYAARWAVAGAFGDNFDQAARRLGLDIGLDDAALEQLRLLGICLNYNGYGFDLDDLLFHPVALFELLHPYGDPLEFVQNENGFAELRAGYEEDMARARDARAARETASSALYLLPDAPWARRTVGVIGNELAQRFPGRAHALLVEMADGGYRVSVRAPYRRKDGADELCRQFATGGGRKAAAGINRLPADDLDRFVDRFNQHWQKESSDT